METTNPNAAVDFLYEQAPTYAKAKGERIYLEEYRKSLKAILFQQADGKTIADKEAWAYSHPDYIQILEGIRAAVEQEEALKWQMIAAQARIEIWRSQEATSRTVDKAFR